MNVIYDFLSHFSFSLCFFSSWLLVWWTWKYWMTRQIDSLLYLKNCPSIDDFLFFFFFRPSGPVVMNMSGYSEKGFKRKLAVQALFGKVFYLSEVNNETSVWWPFIDSYFLLQLFLALFLFSVKHNFSPYSVNLYERAWKLPFETSHSFLFCWNGCLFWEGSLILQLSFLYEIWFDIDIGIWA